MNGCRPKIRQIHFSSFCKIESTVCCTLQLESINFILNMTSYGIIYVYKQYSSTQSNVSSRVVMLTGESAEWEVPVRPGGGVPVAATRLMLVPVDPSYWEPPPPGSNPSVDLYPYNNILDTPYIYIECGCFLNKKQI